VPLFQRASYHLVSGRGCWPAPIPSEAQPRIRLLLHALRVFCAPDFFRVLFAAPDVSDAKGIDTVMAVPSPPD